MNVKINCDDAWTLSEIIDIIGKDIDFEISDNPDFFFFTDCLNKRCIDYDCARIILIAENVRPDFNLYDYAIGFDHMDFGDRYLYYPYFLRKSRKETFLAAAQKHELPDEELLSKKKFCNTVVSNGAARSKIYDQFLDELCAYKKVDSGGGYRNNMPDGKKVENKYSFQKEYKFSMALENSSYRGYTTEKIIDAWAAGSVPIYWGDPDVAKVFNKDAFININDFDTMQDAIKYIQAVNENDELYLKIQHTPMMDNPYHFKEIYEKKLHDFLVNILSKEPREAIYRTNVDAGWGQYIERDIKRHRIMDESTLVRWAYFVHRKLHKIK